MIMTWVAILIVFVVGALLAYWHFSDTQILSINRRTDGGSFDGVSGTGPSDHGHDGGPGDGGADAGGVH